MSTSYDSFTLGDNPWYNPPGRTGVPNQPNFQRNKQAVQKVELPFSEQVKSLTDLRKERLKERVYTAREREPIKTFRVYKGEDNNRSFGGRPPLENIEEEIIRQGAARALPYNQLANENRAVVPIAEKVSATGYSTAVFNASLIAKPLIDIYDGARRYSQATSELVPSQGPKVIQTLADEVNNKNQQTAIDNEKANNVEEIVEGVVEAGLIAAAILL